MGVLLTLIAGLVVWVVLWALGAKGFDAFMITTLMLVIAAAGYMLGSAPTRQAPRGLTRPEPGGSPFPRNLPSFVLLCCRGRNGCA